jgi:hypothetical protein
MAVIVIVIYCEKSALVLLTQTVKEPELVYACFSDTSANL